MFMVASYDIPGDQRRARVADILKDYGRRVQYSVFECDLDNARFSEMLNALQQAIDEREDSLRIYKLCEGCLSRVSFLGKSGTYDEPDVIVI